MVVETVAAAIAAEEVVSTTVQGGVVAGYAIAKRTLPLKATFTCIGTGPGGDTPDSLARSSHSINIIGGDIYVFGGLVSEETLAGNEMHILKMSNVGGSGGAQYKSVPALAPTEGGDVPKPRAGHTTCTMSGKIYLFGGYDDVSSKSPIDKNGCVWIWNPENMEWTFLDPANDTYPSRYDHALLPYQENKLILHGGCSSQSSGPRTDTWVFDLGTRIWTELPPLEPPGDDQEASDAPTPIPVHASAPPSVAIANDCLYLITGTSTFSSKVHSLDLLSVFPPSASENTSHAPAASFSFPLSSAITWKTLEFPTNPLTPGPRPRKGAGLVPVHTGLGRVYLLLMLGAKDDTRETEAAAPATSATEKHQSFNAAMLPATKQSVADDESGQKTASNEAASLPAPEEEAPSAAESYSGLWVLQLPSTKLTPAQAKDAAREKLNMETHTVEWAEVEVVTKEEAVPEVGLVAGIFNTAKAVASTAGDVVTGHGRDKSSGSASVNDRVKSVNSRQGKSHPGPRGYFGCQSVDGTRVVLWGGLNAKNEREADGWMIDLDA